MATALWVSAPLLFAISLLGSLAPYWITPVSGTLSVRQTRVLSLGNCFAGGILLATAVVHMTPEQFESAEELGVHAPIPQLFSLLGFLLLLFLQYSGIILSIRECYHARHDAPAKTDSLSTSIIVTPSTEKEQACDCSVVEAGGQVEPARDHSVCEQTDHEHQSHHDIIVNGMLPILLSVVLSLHSALLGVAIGASQDTKSYLPMLLSLFPHQFFEAFALGVCCRKGLVPFRSALAGLTVFSIVLPLFIVVGILISESADPTAQLWMDVVLLGLSAGTFFCIAFLEIFAEELCHATGNGKKLLAVTLGVAVIVGLGFIPEAH